MRIRLRYNAPVTLSFSFIAMAVLLIDIATPGDFQLTFFSVGPTMNFLSILDWVRLFSHVLGHASADHLMGNLAFILLLGPILEERHGSYQLLFMILITAAVTGLADIFLSHAILLGASGVVFMMILLASFTNFRKGEIPLSFVLVVLLYVMREVVAALDNDSISQLAHILGGAVGSIFGFASGKTGGRKASEHEGDGEPEIS